MKPEQKMLMVKLWPHSWRRVAPCVLKDPLILKPAIPVCCWGVWRRSQPSVSMNSEAGLHCDT